MAAPPFLVRYGLLLTALTYGLAAVVATELTAPPEFPLPLWRGLLASVAASGLWLWFAPTVRALRVWHVAVPTALLIYSVAAHLTLAVATVGVREPTVWSQIVSTVYISVCQYAFLPLSLAFKAGKRP